jgi:hypothetical protein
VPASWPDLGLQVDERHLQGPRLGVVRACADIDDVQFEIKLPQHGGVEKYTGDYLVP